MIVLTVKTDQKIAEVGLFKSKKKLDYTRWEAYRELSVTIPKKIEEMLSPRKLSWDSIGGIIFYEGPGSFTGLRIGASVVNALASSLDIPTAQTSGADWIDEGLKKLSETPKSRMVTPKYGSLPHTTKPRK
jgi:tRNA threonylcarbamoyladenosine biosynthesis protein TsaB